MSEIDRKVYVADASYDFVEKICTLYGDRYDDRVEDSRIGGANWKPGMKSEHKSLREFKRELEAQGIELSTTKIQKILITGGAWSTERSRAVSEVYNHYRKRRLQGGEGLDKVTAVQRTALDLGITTATVVNNLPYDKAVYNDAKGRNAAACEKWREKKKAAGG